jgi:hypothetical protein
VWQAQVAFFLDIVPLKIDGGIFKGGVGKICLAALKYRQIFTGNQRPPAELGV